MFTVIILIVIVMLTCVPIVYAKYICIEKSNSRLNIAQPIFEMQEKQTTQISKTNNIGYYEFSIKNFNETNISDIGFLYNIEIISDTNIPLEFELYKENEIIPLYDLKTQQLSISGGQKEEHKYKLKAIYDNTNEYEGNITKEVQIKVWSEQEKI